MDMNQYMEIFIEESKEHLQILNETLLELENSPENMELLNEVFRVSHTLKGMSATMGFNKMKNLTHNMENVLSEIRNGKIAVTSNLLDVLFKCLDALEVYIDEIIKTNSEGENENEPIMKELISILADESSSSIKAEKDSVVEQSETNEEKLDLDKRLHLNIELASFEINAIREAKEKDYKLYGITVVLSEKCVLKSARSFVIFNNIEELGEIIKTNPDVQSIEDEKFDLTFSVFLLSMVDINKIKKSLSNISEVDEVFVDEILIKDQEIIQEVTNKETNEKVKEEKEDNKKKATKTVRVDIDRLDTLMNLVSELIIVKNGLESTQGNNDNGNYNESIEYLERITTSLHDAVMKVRMVPVEQVFNRFPRMIRDLSRKLDKEIILHMTGKETELDRTVIDEIGEPLIHLLRNAADHALEIPKERASKGKTKEGNIFLRAYQDGNSVVIEVQDDGRGIDVEKIKKKALEKGLVTKESAENMSKKNILELLFAPSFSTAEEITDVSGRGVGLDVVKTKIQILGGHIETDTEIGKGSIFTIRLPLTLAIIQALMINLNNEKYAIPLNTIQTIEDIEVSSIKLIQNKPMIVLRDKVIPLIKLGKVLDVEKEDKIKEHITVVIVKKGDKLAGLVVDSLIGQQEIVIKSLGTYLRKLKMIAGATILGDGEVALILDVNSLV